MTTAGTDQPAPTPGADHLRAAARRFRARYAAPPPPPDDDELQDDDLANWRRRTDHHLRKLDKQLTKQNRLLLITLLSTLADMALKTKVDNALKALHLIP